MTLMNLFHHKAIDDDALYDHSHECCKKCYAINVFPLRFSSRQSTLSPPIQRSSNYHYRDSSAGEQRNSHYPQPIRVSDRLILFSIAIFSYYVIHAITDLPFY